MKTLLNKEFKIGIHPLFHLLALTGALLLIPQWPFFIALMYCFFITIPNIFITGKSQNDIGFSVMLPVAKRSVAGARILAISIIELEYIAVAAVCALLRPVLYGPGNFLLDTNFAYFGLSLVMFGLFNIVFFPMFYKTAHKILLPSLAAIGVTLVFAGAVEMLNLLSPAVNAAIDGMSNVGAQLTVLAVGVIAFVLLNLASYRISARRLENLDL